MLNMQQIEIKRKFFDVIEKLGERSMKVQRKNDIYFLKEYGDDREGFDSFVDRLQKFKVCGVKTPKVYVYDKNQRIVVMDYVEGEPADEYLSKQDLTDDLYKVLFDTYWFAKQDKIYLDFKPENFKISGGKLFYLPFTFKKFVNNDTFINKDLRYWFATQELEDYILSRGLDFDHKRLKSEYETNKFMALVSIKYFR